MRFWERVLRLSELVIPILSDKKSLVRMYFVWISNLFCACMLMSQILKLKKKEKLLLAMACKSHVVVVACLIHLSGGCFSFY